MRKKLAFVLILFMLLSSFPYLRFSPVGVVNSTNDYPVHNIDTGLNYTTIQAAIDAPETKNGHTLFVESGTYYEHVTVTKSLSLIGQSANTTIIDAFFVESAVHIMADNVRFEGFTVTHGGENFPNGGILLQLSTNCTISHNIAIDNKMGILLISSNGNSISDNVVSNNIHGVELYGYSNKNVLESNNISDNNAGILLSQSSGNMIKSNAISRNNFGIEIGGASNDNMISGNTVSDAGAVGIRSVDQSVRNIILNNIVTRSLDAFDLTYANDCMLIGNTASFNSRYGIIIGSSNNSLVIANDLVNNGYGLRIYYPNTNNTISHNNFISNTHQTDTFSSPLNNKWDEGYPSGGNYWSNYNGTDVFIGPFQNQTGSDGIGDQPYIIDGNNKDNYPWMTIYRPEWPFGYETLTAYFELKAKYGSLESYWHALANNYSSLQEDCRDLNATYTAGLNDLAGLRNLVYASIAATAILAGTTIILAVVVYGKRSARKEKDKT